MEERPPPCLNAPIAEAVLELRCTRPDGLALDSLAALHRAETARYPHVHTLHAVEAEFHAKLDESTQNPVTSTARQTPAGFVGISADRLQVFHARRDGFVFLRLSPYAGWADFSAEARRLWTAYREIASRALISRVAIRTINRLEFLAPMADPASFLRTMPLIGSGVGSTISNFYMQVEVPQPEIEGVAIITEATVDPPSPQRIAFVLDIDLWRTADLPQDESSLWELLGRMRRKKDDIFEACMTDRTREGFRQ